MMKVGNSVSALLRSRFYVQVRWSVVERHARDGSPVRDDAQLPRTSLRGAAPGARQPQFETLPAVATRLLAAGV
jgi:hypothetical protein